MSHFTIDEIIKTGVKLTPMMEQYHSIKKNYPDTILLFRMGDFYEVFFEDAKQTSKILNITLTHRGKIGDFPIPMAGIPHHAAVSYIDKLTHVGHKVAICEQVEDPKSSQGIVKRAVTQIVSPAMPYDLDRTQSKDHQYMVAAYHHQSRFYIVALDFTTGNFRGIATHDENEFVESIRKFSPVEFITYMGQWGQVHEELDRKIDLLLNHLNVLKTHLSEEYFKESFTQIYIEKLIPNYQNDKTLKADFPIFNALGALSYYVLSTQKLEQFIHLKPFQLQNENGLLKVTLPTLVGLEILPRNKDSYKDSLLGFFDKTETAMGARKLKDIFIHPLADKKLIDQRLDFIGKILAQPQLQSLAKEYLSPMRDLDRILAKISIGKANSSDLINLSKTVHAFFELSKKIQSIGFEQKLSLKEERSLLQVTEEILKTLNDEIGASLDKGNLIRSGIHQERDRLYHLHLNVADNLLAMENQLKDSTGISKLRIKSNNVTGFFIEVSKGSAAKIPAQFKRIQTLVNAERFTTKELEILEKETLVARDKLEKLEREIFVKLIENVSLQAPSIKKIGEQIAVVDTTFSFAKMAVLENLTRPQIGEKNKILKIDQGFHPLIRSYIKDQFVPHDITLDENVFFGLITGPNMAGKTTVMREVAIIVLLAQMGSYVPAKSAELSIVDYLFSRLGASDDILKGQSTFMVEMAETAEIIRHATAKSLIILDEVGRGTSTYDGLSIAWSLVEYFMQETKALTLFATHYHELIEVVAREKCGKNLTVETINYKGKVQFLYRLIEEGASQSFGIYVAKLAGLPESVLKRSQNLLHQLENQNQQKPVAKMTISTQAKKDDSITPKVHGNQLCFLDEIKEYDIPEYLKDIEKEINRLDISRITPLDALIKLNNFKKQIELN